MGGISNPPCRRHIKPGSNVHALQLLFESQRRASFKQEHYLPGIIVLPRMGCTIVNMLSCFCMHDTRLVLMRPATCSQKFIHSYLECLLFLNEKGR